ncbi:hypothetical protein D9M73_267470 [compost metagenome]
MDVTTLGIERPDEPRTNVEEFRSFNLRANIFHIAAKPCEILAEDEALAGSRAQSAVEAVEHQRIADRRRPAITDRVAQISAGKQRLAGVPRRIAANAVVIRVAEIGALVEADFVIA